MKDVLNFVTTMPGAPSVMMGLMNVMPTSSVVSLAILIKVDYSVQESLTPTYTITLYARCHPKTVSLFWTGNWFDFKAVSAMCWH